MGLTPGLITEENSLAEIDAGIPDTLGQKNMAGSTSVVIASDQSTVPVSLASVPLPTGAATEATLAKLPVAQASTTSGQSGPLVQGAVTTAAPTYTTGQTDPLSLTTAGALRTDSSATTQPVSAVSLPLPTGAATETTLAKLPLAQASTTSGQSGPLVQGAVSTAAPSYTNGQTDPISLTTAGAVRVDGSAVTQPVSAASLPLPSGAATSANQSSELTLIGAVNETAPASDTASSGLNGRLQRIAQRLTSMIALLPSVIGTAWFSRISDGTDTVQVSTSGALKSVDGLSNGGVYGALSVPTANTPVEAKIGVSRLANRKFLQIYSNNNGLFWGLDNTVTTTTGTPLVNAQIITFAIDPDSTFQVWLVGSTNGKSAQVTECP